MDEITILTEKINSLDVSKPENLKLVVQLINEAKVLMEKIRNGKQQNIQS